MKKLLFSFSLVTLLCFLSASSALLAQQAETPEPAPEIKSPIVEVGEYQIFPANRLGNSLYKEKKKIFSRQDLALHGILPIKEGLLYHGLLESGDKVLDFYGDTKELKVTPKEGGFVELRDQKGSSSLFRIQPDGKIQNLLPKSKTAGSLLYNGKDKAAFAHIIKGESLEMPDGRVRYQYTFKLHVVFDDQDNIKTLPGTVAAFSPTLVLTWAKPDVLQYRNSQGEIERLTIGR